MCDFEHFLKSRILLHINSNFNGFETHREGYVELWNGACSQNRIKKTHILVTFVFFAWLRKCYHTSGDAALHLTPLLRAGVDFFNIYAKKHVGDRRI